MSPKTRSLWKLFLESDIRTRLNDAGPGLALAVLSGGQTEYRSFGLAHLEQQSPITPDTLFQVGSITKSFTAQAILHLVRQRSLDLDDLLFKYVPELRIARFAITLRHLLTHTSGIRDYSALWHMSGRSSDDLRTSQQVFDLLIKQEALNFQPGTSFSYSSSGYYLLSLVIERVAGTAYHEFMRREIWRPLGMLNTVAASDAAFDHPKRAYAYSKAEDGYRRVVSRRRFFGAGGMFTSINDLLTWERYLRAQDELVFGPDKHVSKQLVISQLLGDGRRIESWCGLALFSQRGELCQGQGGVYAGYTAWTRRFPRLNMSLVFLSNAPDLPPDLGTRLAEAYLGYRPKATSRDGVTTDRHDEDARIPIESASDYVGVYVSSALDSRYDVVVEKDRMLLFGARPKEELWQALANEVITVRFLRNDAGAVVGLEASSGLARQVRFTRVEKASPEEPARLRCNAITCRSWRTDADGVVSASFGIDYLR